MSFKSRSALQGYPQVGELLSVEILAHFQLGGDEVAYENDPASLLCLGIQVMR